MHLKVFQCGNLEVEKALFKPFLKQSDRRIIIN